MAAATTREADANMGDRTRTQKPRQPKKKGELMAPEKPREMPAESAEATAPAGPKIRWDDTNMKSSYANFCNVASTREEFVLLFGVNQGWQAGQPEIPIQLTDRIIMSPFVANRLAPLLTNVLREYETRFGSLGTPGAPGATA
jgi:hypothetical protein